MRSTSIESYRDLVGSGRIGKLQQDVYNVVFNDGPGTAKELARVSGIDGFWKRLSELRRVGVVEEMGKRTCSITGKKAIVWKTSEMKKEEG